MKASPENTLLIVTQICIGDQSFVPFITQGPNYRILRKARNIDELLIAIRKAITRDCYDSGCTNRQRRDVSRVPTGKIFSQLPARKRVIRNKNAEKPVKKVNQQCLNDKKRQMALNNIRCNFILILLFIFGVLTSALSEYKLFIPKIINGNQLEIFFKQSDLEIIRFYRYT